MIRKYNAVFAALLLVSLFLVATAAETFGQAPGDRVTVWADGSASYNWDPDQIITGENNLITSVPGIFTGVNVAPLIGANTFYTNGYTGTGTITLNSEAGHIWNGHETLLHALTQSNAAGVPSAPFGMPAFDRHATWVGMMIGGRQGGAVPGTYQEGIARNTDLRSGAIATSWVTPAFSLSFSASLASLAFPYAGTSGFGTADTINSSWGATGASGSPEAGGTDVRSMIIDSLANGSRFTTFVASAGNSGSGSNTVGAPGSGYNGITVGALQNNGANVYSSVATFSSRGPQDYKNGAGVSTLLARAPVDIAAPGTDLTSAFYGGQTGGNDASLAGSVATPGANLYNGGLGGTSFASPITAACVSLMHQAGAAVVGGNSEDTRVIKANLLNAASKIAGWNNGETPHPNGNGGVTTTQALDYASGAGAVDMTRTYSQYLSGQTDIAGMTGGSTPQVKGWDYANATLGGNTDVVITTPLLSGSEFRATLTWFRDRTYFSSSSQSDNAFADLNLQVWNSTFTTLYSESKSLYNEVEHLTFNLPATGTYGLRVAYPSNQFGSISSEEFGLAWWGVEAIPEPSSIVMLLTGLICVGWQRKRRLA